MDGMEGMIIKGVARDSGIVAISVLGVPDRPGVAFKLFSLLGQKGINVDVILQAVARDNRRDIVFTVVSDAEEDALELIKGHKSLFDYSDIAVDRDVSKVSIVGAGMLSHSGIASRMFGALYDAHINIKMITTSEIKISVIIDGKDADRAVEVVHDEFIK
jgi:aspartate kinase